MIEATYTLSVDDFMEAGRAGYRKDLSITRYRAQWLTVGIGLIAVVLTQKPSPIYWLLLLAALLIWSAVTYPGQHLRKHFQRSVTDEQVLVQINEAGVTTLSRTSRAELKWAAFKSMVETPGTLSLLTINNVLYVFPKRAFSEQACNELRLLILQNGIPDSK